MELSTINGRGGGDCVERGEGEAARARIPAVSALTPIKPINVPDILFYTESLYFITLYVPLSLGFPFSVDHADASAAC